MGFIQSGGVCRRCTNHSLSRIPSPFLVTRVHHSAYQHLSAPAIQHIDIQFSQLDGIPARGNAGHTSFPGTSAVFHLQQCDPSLPPPPQSPATNTNTTTITITITSALLLPSRDIGTNPPSTVAIASLVANAYIGRSVIITSRCVHRVRSTTRAPPPHPLTLFLTCTSTTTSRSLSMSEKLPTPTATTTPVPVPIDTGYHPPSPMTVPIDPTFMDTPQRALNDLNPEDESESDTASTIPRADPNFCSSCPLTCYFGADCLHCVNVCCAGVMTCLVELGMLLAGCGECCVTCCGGCQCC
ncbi:hypothetical protein EX30DRAFT_273558 [Ascodesmis nigricans]|uniref:Uncharacterized protein n=1 Tax=Ascodesmis nigricans TaxID=341454 RepID=A0A4S2MXG8_9PEZI|nr:hypothetical protein EX30DRAFT_273558 [Ascodesmis nigricans]